MVTPESAAPAATAASSAVSVTPAAATPGTAAPGPTGSLAPDEREVSFTSGPDTLYGTLLVPAAAARKRAPAALILAGSGPTDRNGNSALLSGPVNTLANFARALADQGVVSLRYDKLGAGKRGLQSHRANPGDVGFDLFVDEAKAAYAFLGARPEVDPQRTFILGHSEGGLIALVLADQLRDGAAPAALVLASAPGSPYLEVVTRQLREQYDAAVQAGAVSRAQADTTLAAVDRAIAGLKQDGKVPAGTDFGNANVAALFNPSVQTFYAQAERYDPQQLATRLPPALPVLVLRGLKDQQVESGDFQNLTQAFRQANSQHLEAYELANVDHVYKEVPGTPNPTVDYTNPALRFSQEAAQRLDAFLKANRLSGGGP